MIDENVLFQQILFMMYEELKKNFTVKDFIEDELNYNSHDVLTIKTATVNPSYIQVVQDQKELKNNYASMLNGSEVSFGTTNFYFKSKYKKLVEHYCKEMKNEDNLRIIPDPFNLSLRDINNNDDDVNLPTNGFVLAKCSEVSFPDNWVLKVAPIVLKKAGPFISKIAKGQ